MTEDVVVEGLTDAELARIDAMAAERNVTPDALMAELAELGIDKWEREGVPLPPRVRGDALP